MAEPTVTTRRINSPCFFPQAPAISTLHRQFDLGGPRCGRSVTEPHTPDRRSSTLFAAVSRDLRSKRVRGHRPAHNSVLRDEHRGVTIDASFAPVLSGAIVTIESPPAPELRVTTSGATGRLTSAAECS